MEAATIFPRRRSVWGALAVSLALGIGGVGVLAADVPTAFRWRDVVFVAAVPLAIRRAARTIRELRKPVPQVRLDEHGIEGSFGRERWEHVERVGIHWCSYATGSRTRRLVLWLRPGAPPPEAARGRFYGRAYVRDDRIELPLWARKRQVLDDVRRFYAGPAA